MLARCASHKGKTRLQAHTAEHYPKQCTAHCAGKVLGMLQPWSRATDQLLTVLLQLLTPGLSQAGLQPLVLQLLLQLLKLLPADSPLLQLTDAPCPGSQLNLQCTLTGTLSSCSASGVRHIGAGCIACLAHIHSIPTSKSLYMMTAEQLQHSLWCALH